MKLEGNKEHWAETGLGRAEGPDSRVNLSHFLPSQCPSTFVASMFSFGGLHWSEWGPGGGHRSKTWPTTALLSTMIVDNHCPQ